MSKGKEFVKNTLILLLGKFATQFMSLLLLPLYTSKLATSDYGTVDLIQTYITLLIPVLTLRMDSATFRFLVDVRKSPEKTKGIISNVLFVLLWSVVLALVISLIVSIFVTLPNHLWIIMNLVVLMISGVTLQILRGTGKIMHYTIASVITGVSTLVMNVILIAFMGRGADSILISSSIANIICILFVFFSAKLYKNFSPSMISKKTIKEFLKFSVPMIPNSLSWWVVNASDRTIIRIFLNAAANGIYTVSCKFSNILNSVFSIFNVSWQESASLHIDDKDRDEFFTKMINQLLIFFSGIALLILVAIPIFYNLLIGEQYHDSYNYIPVLLYANSWHVLISLIGGIYVAKKKTKAIATTTIISAVINIVVDLVLINFIGLHAATISTLVSYMAMGLYRVHDCKKYVKFKFDVKTFTLFTIAFIASSVIYHLNIFWMNILNAVLVVYLVVCFNQNNMKSILKMLKSKKKKKEIDVGSE